MSTGHGRAGLLIGFTGRAGAGKDTCAQLLVARHGFTALAYADALRAEVAQAFGIDAEMLTDRDAKEMPNAALTLARCPDEDFIVAVRIHTKAPRDMTWRDGAIWWHNELTTPRSPRWIMQRWGTEYRRATCGEMYWTAQLAHRVRALRAENPAARICITDVRFANEANSVTALGGHVVRVHRPDLPPMPADTRSHASEMAPVPSVEVAHNDGDLGHLDNELQRVIGALLLRERHQAGLRAIVGERRAPASTLCGDSAT